MRFTSQVRGGRKELWAWFSAMLVLLLVFLTGCQGPTSINANPNVGNYRVEIKTDPLTLKPPQLATLSYQLTNTQTNKVVDAYQRVSGALLHNILIRDDLQYFRHSSTDTLTRDAASVLTYFPTTGNYHSFTLVQPIGAQVQIFTATISSGQGESETKLEVDERTSKLSGGVRVDLLTGSEPVRAGKPAQLVFRVTERGEPVTGLWPLYDAPGYLWIVNEKLDELSYQTATSTSRRLVPELTATAGNSKPGSTAVATPATVTPGTTPGGPVPTFAPGIAEAIRSATSVPPPTLLAVQLTAQSSVMGTPDVRPTFGYGPELVFTHTFPRAGLYKMWLEIKYRELILQYDYFVRVSE